MSRFYMAFCLVLGLFTNAAIWSQQLPVIHTNIDPIHIREGAELRLGAWTLAPELKPDVYTSSSVGETVTFITDIDSISFTITKDGVFDFVVVMEGKDSAYTQLQYEPSKLEVLQQGASYDLTANDELPPFYYQDSSAAELKAIRAAFNLDSIAGTGNEVSKLLNLLHWTHELIPHDGQHNNPDVLNALSMLNTCQKDERGLNCRGLSIFLNECYLALGYKARYVTCMPKDSVFQDCHVINMVFSDELDKWVWLDPTHDTYVMDDKGQLLGFSEVRERLINGQTLIINPAANWNHRSSTVKEYYLDYYMAKNLYRFSTPLRSEYNYETHKPNSTREHVELLPLDAYQQTPKMDKYESETTTITYYTYKTNNPNLFWAKPN